MSARTLAAFKLAELEQTLEDVLELLDMAFEATGDGSVMAARIILSNGRRGIAREYFPPAYLEDCKQFDICPGCEGTGRDPRGLQHVCNRCGGSGTFSAYRLPGLAPVHPTLRSCLERILAHHCVASQFLQGAEECLELGTVLLLWRAPQRVFVNSMSDLFHPDVPNEFLDRVFAVMALASQHTFMILTKRAERMREYLEHRDESAWGKLLGMAAYLDEATGVTHGFWPLPNLWLGVTMESPQYYWRYEELLITPAAKRFVSFEPLLAEMDIGRPHPDWVICGGESGPNARPMHPDWARSLRDQCAAAGVPFFFKQWGEWKPSVAWMPGFVRQGAIMPDGSQVPHDVVPQDVGGQRFVRVGSQHRLAHMFPGRLLDGVEHNAMPEVQS